MNYWLPKNKTLAISLGTVIAVALGYVVWVYLVNAKITQIERAYTESESAVAQQERARTIAAIAGSNKQEIQTLRDFFVASGDEVLFIERIEEIGKAAGLSFEIASISQGKAAGDAVKEDITLRIAMKGSWQSVMTFVKQLETIPFGVRITDFKMDTVTPGNWSGFIELIIFRAK